MLFFTNLDMLIHMDALNFIFSQEKNAKNPKLWSKLLLFDCSVK